MSLLSLRTASTGPHDERRDKPTVTTPVYIIYTANLISWLRQIIEARHLQSRGRATAVFNSFLSPIAGRGRRRTTVLRERRSAADQSSSGQLLFSFGSSSYFSPCPFTDWQCGAQKHGHTPHFAVYACIKNPFLSCLYPVAALSREVALLSARPRGIILF